MRRVPRRHTRVQSERVFSPTEQPRKLNRPTPPWETRKEMPTGAPRTPRSNIFWPVEVRGMNGPVEVGTIDRALHLYTHWGLTEVSALMKEEGEWHVVYDLRQEWSGVVQPFAFWLEYVSDSRALVARISRDEAERFGHQTKNGSTPVWAVPLKHYSVHRRHAA